MASWNLRTYDVTHGAEFTAESARAQLTYYLEYDGDDPVGPTTEDLIEKIKELLGWTDTAVSLDGGLSRQLPQCHPIHRNLVVSNVRVEAVPNEEVFETRPADPDEALEAEPASDAVVWGSWRFDVTFAPRPYPMISDSLMEQKIDSWSDEDGALVAFFYREEWLRHTVFEVRPREEYLRAKIGESGRFVTGSGGDPDNVPVPAIAVLPLPDDTLLVTWYGIPSRFIDSPDSNLRRYRNRVNQAVWMGYEPGELLYKGFTEKRYSYPFPDLDPDWGGVGVFATEKLSDVTLEFHVTRRVATDPPASVANPHWVVGGHNLFFWIKTRKAYYVAAQSDDPLLRFPFFNSFRVEFLFKDPDSV